MRNSLSRAASNGARSQLGSGSRINQSTSSSRSGSDSRRSVDETSELGFTFQSLDTPISCISLNYDSSKIVVGGRNLLKIFDAEGEEFVELMNLRVGLQQGNQQHCNPADVTWSPHHDNVIVSTGYNGAVVVWDLNRTACHKQEYVFVAHPRMVNRLLLHPTKPHLLMTGSQDGFMKIYDIRVRTLQCTLNGNANSGIRDIQFDPFCDTTYAAAYDSGVVQLWDIRYPSKWERHYLAHNGPVLSLDWHRSEQHWLATGGRDKLISIWDMRDSQRLPALYSVQTIGGVVKVRWRPRYKYHICSSALLIDYGVNTWDLQRPYAPVTSFAEHRDLIAGICFRNDDPDVFYTAGRDGMMVRYIYSLPTYRPQKSFNPVVVDVGVHGCVLHAGHDELIASTAPPPPPPQKQKTGGSSSSVVPHTRLPVFYRRTAEETSNDSKVLVLSLFSYFNHVECLSMDGFVKMAKSYKLSGLPVSELCRHNAQVATSLNQFRIAESWRMLEVMITAASVNSRPNDTDTLPPVPVTVELTPVLSQTPDTASSHLGTDTPQSATPATEENPFLAQMEKSRTVGISERKRVTSLQPVAVTQTQSASLRSQSASVPFSDTSSGVRQTSSTVKPPLNVGRKVSLTTGRLTSKNSLESNAGSNVYVMENSAASSSTKFSTSQLTTSSSFHDSRSFQVSQSPTVDSITATYLKGERTKSRRGGSTSVSQPTTPGSAVPKFITSTLSNKTATSGSRSVRPDLESDRWVSSIGDAVNNTGGGQEVVTSGGQRPGKSSSQQSRSRTGTLEKADGRTSSTTALGQRRKLGLASLDTRATSVFTQQLAAAKTTGVPRELDRVKEQEKNMSLPPSVAQSAPANSSGTNVESGITRAGELTAQNVAVDDYRLVDSGKLLKRSTSWSSGPGFYSAVDGSTGGVRARGFLRSGSSEAYNSEESLDFSDCMDSVEEGDSGGAYDDDDSDDDDDYKSNDDVNSASDDNDLDEIRNDGYYKSTIQCGGYLSNQRRKKKMASVRSSMNTSTNQALCCSPISTLPGDPWLEFGPAFCSFFSNLEKYNGGFPPRIDGFEDCMLLLSSLSDAVQQEEEVLSRKGSGASSLEPLAPSRAASMSREGSPAGFDCTLVPSGGVVKTHDVVAVPVVRAAGGRGLSNDGVGPNTAGDSVVGGANQSSRTAAPKINSVSMLPFTDGVNMELALDGFSDELVTLRQDILQTPSFMSFLKTWNCMSVMREMLEFFADQNDVQTAVSMVVVLGELISRLEINEKQLEHWFFSYIDVLSKMELWKEATEVINLSCVSEVTQLTLTSTQIYTFCSRCNKPLLKAGWTCQRCNQYIHKCCLCHLPVKGLYVWCQGCAHGGHPAHLKDWFSTHRLCPAGCGHQCEYM